MNGRSERTLGYLIPQFPGQTHAFFWREIQELERRGVDVALFSTRRPPRGLVSHAWSQEAMARTHYLAMPHTRDLTRPWRRLPHRELLDEARREGRSFVRDVLLSVAAAWQLADECERRGIGHVHVHSCGRAALIAALAKRMRGLDYSLTLHGDLHGYGPGQRFKWRHAKFATVVTNRLLAQVRAELGDALPARVLVQSMGVDTERLAREVQYEPRRELEKVRVFSCGRLNLIKGHVDLMDAMALLRDGGHEVELEIAGEDDEGGDGYRLVLERKIRELRLEGHVKLLGAVDAEEVKRRLMAAHVFVLASWEEAIGVALMEAMSCEVPTIATDVGGVSELIRDGIDGVLVPPHDPERLAQTVLDLARSGTRCLELGRAGRNRVVESFQSGLGAEALVHGLGWDHDAPLPSATNPSTPPS